ncbi:MAG: hypothetical protein HC812_11730, partial [Leptolyngbya sp. RL_3_1]|nr:hypothetical protein [Leptolyngbya sp. RL_3_1]
LTGLATALTLEGVGGYDRVEAKVTIAAVTPEVRRSRLRYSQGDASPSL